MAISEDKKPIYDERVEEILQGMANGKTREEFAKEYGHKSIHGINKYMKSRNFAWDTMKKQFIPAFSRLEGVNFDELLDGSKASQVIALFNKEGTNSKIIAKRLGFEDHRELASYMKGKGYAWSMDKGNYAKEVGEISSNVEVDMVLSNDLQESSITMSAGEFSKEILRFLPLLEMLERNKDRIMDIIIPSSETGEIPRYAIPGVFVTKSVHMTSPLDQLVREFSREKNISQRDIFSVALIQFFRRYGFEREVEQLLGQ
ncbi:hypothetical protein [Falsibacillus pallidus]|uniref:hypothetical protein n=1 Tax=Falsibacillus pallidus TaxID=493781 RepID=UPI003D96EA99